VNSRVNIEVRMGGMKTHCFWPFWGFLVYLSILILPLLGSIAGQKAVFCKSISRGHWPRNPILVIHLRHHTHMYTEAG
jgi:hypothetical protein